MDTDLCPFFIARRFFGAWFFVVLAQYILCDEIEKGERKLKTKKEAIASFLLFCYLIASKLLTARATVAPTIGLFPIPINPIISTWAGTDELPAN